MLSLAVVLIVNLALTAVSSRAAVAQSFGKIPLSFELNQGQAGSPVKFLARAGRSRLYFSPTEVMWTFNPVVRSRKSAGFDQTDFHGRGVNDSESEKTNSSSTVRLLFLGANPCPALTGLDEQLGKVNYMLGNDPTQWRTGLPMFGKVRYERLYPGIDLVCYGKEQQLEYDFLVSPGADPKMIQFALTGVNEMEIDRAGNLLLWTADGQLQQSRPLLYQEKEGVRTMIDGGFMLLEEEASLAFTSSGACLTPERMTGVGFWVGPYDRTRPLVIDPVLVYSTYFGGFDFDAGYAIAVDATGSAYVTGWTFSGGFGSSDIFVAKLNPAGDAVTYLTTIGGTGPDQSLGIVVDHEGQACVVGQTSSFDFPITNAVQSVPGGNGDAFVLKLNAAGNQFVYSTYLGGSETEMDTRPDGGGIAVDQTGNVYVVGTTSSANFPTTPGAFQTKIKDDFAIDEFTYTDVVVSKLNPSGSALLYSTYIGGNATDAGYGIAVDASGQAYITGSTSSQDFPLVNALEQRNDNFRSAFVTKLNSAGSGLIFSTLFTGADQGDAIALDGEGNAYITGITYGGLSTTPGAFQPARRGASGDAFVAKLNSEGSAVLYATYLGASSTDEALGIAVNSRGQFAITGFTSFMPVNQDFPTKDPLQSYQNNLDAFVAKFESDGTLIYSTYLGGSASDRGRGIALSEGGDVYVIGETESNDFPVKSALRTNSFGGEAFIVRLSDGSSALPPPASAGTFLSVRFNSKGFFIFELSTEPNRPFQIEASEDLIDWSTLAGFSQADGQFVFADTDAGFVKQRFYRLVFMTSPQEEFNAPAVSK